MSETGSRAPHIRLEPCHQLRSLHLCFELKVMPAILAALHGGHQLSLLLISDAVG